MELHIRCSELRIFVNNYPLWKDIVLGRAKRNKTLFKGFLNHAALVTALRRNIPIEKAIFLTEKFFRTSCDLEQREKICSVFRLLKSFNISDLELFVKDEKLKLVGRIDAVSGYTPIEIKFGKRTKGDAYQLASYAICMGTTRGILVYPDELLPINFSEKFLEETKELIRRCLFIKKRLMVKKDECGNRNVRMLYREKGKTTNDKNEGYEKGNTTNKG